MLVASYFCSASLKKLARASHGAPTRQTAYPSFPSSLLCSLRSYFGNHSDAAGFHYHPSFASGYDLLEMLLQLQPEIMDQLMEHFLEGKPFKTVRGAVV